MQGTRLDASVRLWCDPHMHLLASMYTRRISICTECCDVAEHTYPYSWSESMLRSNRRSCGYLGPWCPHARGGVEWDVGRGS